MKIFAAIMGVILLIGAFFAMYYFGQLNTANSFEQRLIVLKQDNENVLSTYSQKVQEAAQITTMQKDDLRELFNGSLAARYGSNGSQAVVQFIREKAPNLDPRLYLRLQSIITEGRSNFEKAQRSMLDTKRAYLTSLGSIPAGKFMQMGGYPTIKIGFRGDTDDYKIVTTEYASDAFQKGKETGPINIRPQAPKQ